MNQISRYLKLWKLCLNGGITVSFALSSGALLVILGATFDYIQMTKKHAALQAMADGAAVVVAQEMSLANAKNTVLDSVAKTFVKTNQEKQNSIAIATSFSSDKVSVTVELKNTWAPVFAHMFVDGVTPVKASATAKIVGSGSVCMIGLDTKEKETIHLTKRAKLDASGCGVFSNSKHPKSIKVDDDASILADLTCSVGGISGLKKASIIPAPLTDCPQITDPLAGREPPKIGLCDYNKLKFDDQNATLYPGTYCGGLKVKGTSKIKLKPGIYVIKGGKLEVTEKAFFEGENVGFFLAGDKAKLAFKKETTISLTAPKDGVMAGLLFFESRSSSKIEKHEITSNNARMLLGAIYLPNGTLRIDSEGPIADKAAYTAIIARRIELDEGPTLYLNSDYEATDVPFPKGLLGGRVVLTK